MAGRAAARAQRYAWPTVAAEVLDAYEDAIATPAPSGAASATTVAADAGTMTSRADAATTAAPTVPQGGGGGKNVVIVQNRTNGRVQVRANVQLNGIPGPNVQPVNIAIATSSCTDCETLAVALQLDLASTDAWLVAPQNAAVATNARCSRCVTVAHAVQYLYIVDDPTDVSADVRRAIADLDRALVEIDSDPTITLAEAEARIDVVIAEFGALARTVGDDRRTAGD
jgi:hypothetical protein